MSFTTTYNGRLCNQIIRNLAVSRIAEKHNLHVTYSNYDIISKLGISLFCGTKTYDNTIALNEDNYVSIYENDVLESNIDANQSFFQTRPITNLLCSYIRNVLQPDIIEKNPFKHRYNANNDVCIHIRLTDTERWNPGLTYYINVLSKLQFDTLYITSDDPSNAIIQTIKSQYPDSIVINYNEIQTLQFASTCKHIILSHGSFSAVIGYLSFFSDVHYPEYQPGKIWYGDIFSIDGWIKHNVLPRGGH